MDIVTDPKLLTTEQMVILYGNARERFMYRLTGTNHQALRAAYQTLKLRPNLVGIPTAFHDLGTPGPSATDLCQADPYFKQFEDTPTWDAFQDRLSEATKLTQHELTSHLQVTYPRLTQTQIKQLTHDLTATKQLQLSTKPTPTDTLPTSDHQVWWEAGLKLSTATERLLKDYVQQHFPEPKSKTSEPDLEP